MKNAALALMIALSFSFLIYPTVPEGYFLNYNKTVTVPADAPWVNTYVTLNEGDLVEITASGKWGYDPRPQFQFGPDGVASPLDQSQGELVGRIANNSQFDIGSSYSGTADANGTLYLQMHDTTQRQDNVGEVSVNITVFSKTPLKPSPGTEQQEAESDDEDETDGASEQEDAEESTESAACTAGLVLLMALLTLYAHHRRIGIPRTL